MVIDEAKWLLGVQRFLGELEVWLKARAKKNLSVWLATQELYDVQRTTLWQAVLASMPTKLLLPNPQALSAAVRPVLYGHWGAEHGVQQLAQAQPFRDYLYVSPLGTRLFQCTLSPVERLLCAASRLEELAVLDTMAEKIPAHDLPAAWLRHWGYDEEAAILHAHTKETPYEDPDHDPRQSRCRRRQHPAGANGDRHAPTGGRRGGLSRARDHSGRASPHRARRWSLAGRRLRAPGARLTRPADGEGID